MELSTKADSNSGSALALAYSEYKIKPETIELIKNEKIKNKAFSTYDHFKKNVFNSMKSSYSKPATKPAPLKSFSATLDDILLNQDKLEVPGNYKNQQSFSGY